MTRSVRITEDRNSAEKFRTGKLSMDLHNTRLIHDFHNGEVGPHKKPRVVSQQALIVLCPCGAEEPFLFAR